MFIMMPEIKDVTIFYKVWSTLGSSIIYESSLMRSARYSKSRCSRNFNVRAL